MTARQIHWKVAKIPAADTYNLESQGFPYVGYDAWHIEGVPGLFPSEKDADHFLTIMHAKLNAYDWFPLDIQPPKTGKYLVGHRGHQEVFSFLHPKDNWISGLSVGWCSVTFRHPHPEAFRSTHWMLYRECP